MSAAVGGGAGGIWGKIRDKGFKDEDLKAVGEEMEPGTSAIIAIAEDRVLERLQNGLEGYDRIARHAVSAEAAMAITAEVDDEEPPRPDRSRGATAGAGAPRRPSDHQSHHAASEGAL